MIDLFGNGCDNMSNAEEIKKYYKQLLMDGQPHSREELYLFARENGKNYTDGMLAGALKTLVDKEICYVQVERGIYQFVKEKENIIFQYVDIFKDTLKQLNNVDINVFKLVNELDDERKEKLQKIKECIEVLDDTLDSLTRIE